MLVRSLDNREVKYGEHKLFISSKIPEHTEYFKISFGRSSHYGISVTKQYYDFLKSKKKTQRNWRYNDNKNHISVGTNSGMIIFGCLSDEELIEFFEFIKKWAVKVYGCLENI